jgi:hypothetical protein
MGKQDLLENNIYFTARFTEMYLLYKEKEIPVNEFSIISLIGANDYRV